MLLVMAAIFGVMAGLVAFEKGRSPIGWFLGGLLVGPFSLIVAALPAKAVPGRYSECPACLEIVRDEAKVCRYCGTAFE